MFDWDSSNIEHIAQHHVTPAEAEQVIHNDPLDRPPPQFRNGEKRDSSSSEKRTPAGFCL